MLWANRNGFFYVLDRANGPVPLGHAVRQGELGERTRRQAAGRSRRRSRPACRPGPATRAGPTGTRRPTARAPGSSTSPRGRTTRRSSDEETVDVRARPPLHAAAAHAPLTPTPDAPGIGIGRRGPDQQLDRCGRQRRRDRDRSADRAAEVEVRAVRRHRQRHPDHRVDLLFTGGREGYFYALDARTGALLWKASLGGQIVTGRSPTRSTASNTSR